MASHAFSFLSRVVNKSHKQPYRAPHWTHDELQICHMYTRHTCFDWLTVKSREKQYNVNETRPPTVSKCWLLFSLLFSFPSLIFHVAVIQQSVTSYRIITCYQSFEHTKHKMQGTYSLSLFSSIQLSVIICVSMYHNLFLSVISSRDGPGDVHPQTQLRK